MTEFQIPKRQVDARIHVVGSPPLAARLFLSEVAETYAGPERPSDLLRSRQFVAVDRKDGGFAVVNTANIEAFSVPHDAEFGLGALATEDLAIEAATRRRLRVTLTSGARLEGIVIYLQPPGNQRVIDFINDIDEVLALRGSTFAHVIARRYVSMVEIVEDDADSN